MGKDACEEPSSQMNFTKMRFHRLSSPDPSRCLPESTLKPELLFPAMGGTGSQGFTSNQDQLFAQLQGAPFSCVTCHWHPLESNGRPEAPVCLGNRGAVLGEGSLRPSPWGLAGKGHSQDSFPPEGLRHQTGCQGLTSHSPLACRSWARGEMGTASTGPCPRQPASTASRGRRAGRGWGSSEAWGTCQCCLNFPQTKTFAETQPELIYELHIFRRS